MSAWLDRLHQRFACTPEESAQILATSDVGWEPNITAALHLATSTDTAPRRLLGAHAILFNDLAHSLWKRDLEYGFCALVAQGWQRAARNLWSFRYPTQVPAVLAACNRENVGLVSTVRVLDAAMRAVGGPGRAGTPRVDRAVRRRRRLKINPAAPTRRFPGGPRRQSGGSTVATMETSRVTLGSAPEPGESCREPSGLP